VAISLGSSGNFTEFIQGRCGNVEKPSSAKGQKVSDKRSQLTTLEENHELSSLDWPLIDQFGKIAQERL
jgi:hypothetical protein